MLLEASARATNKFGTDVYSQILWMKLDGITTREICESLGCSRDLVQAAITAWQEQIQVREGRNWIPARRSAQRWAYEQRGVASSVTSRKDLGIIDMEP